MSQILSKRTITYHEDEDEDEDKGRKKEKVETRETDRLCDKVLYYRNKKTEED